MEQEQILATLTGQLGQTSLSERTISDYVSENLPAEGQPFDFEKHVKVLKSLNGNLSKLVADTVKQQIADFKKNYKPETTLPPDPPAGEDGANKTLLERIAALEKKSQEAERKNLTDSLRRKVSGMSKSFNVANPNLWKDCVDSIAVEQEDTAESLTAKAKKAYEKKLRDYFGEGAAPYNGEGNSSAAVDSTEAKKRREAFKSRMKSRGRL